MKRNNATSAAIISASATNTVAVPTWSSVEPPRLAAATSAYTPGATNSPSAFLITASLRKDGTSRGEYWPAPNCTTRTATDTTNPENATMPAAIDSMIDCASPGVTPSRPPPVAPRSIAGIAIPKSTAPSRYIDGTITRLCANVSRACSRKLQNGARSLVDSPRAATVSVSGASCWTVDSDGVSESSGTFTPHDPAHRAVRIVRIG